ncbi:fibronectin type III domain-containing protein [Kineococcus rubinsiae]|uniref:fibronectin type III domain-containing protein n=1 Tax=Kineococcus rubinsiae TaxID=2609562 RepID=UPI0014310310|nr:fibronectin type III domain-containing protein [Kineococcus rubinsiae]NIZ90484.1 hypothetical protein [Kineococcus rubinsiae]
MSLPRPRCTRHPLLRLTTASLAAGTALLVAAGPANAAPAVPGAPSAATTTSSASALTAPTFPDAPDNLVARRAGNTVVVTFQAPAVDGGAVVRRYRVTPVVDGVWRTDLTRTTTALTASFTGLTGWVWFVATAENAVGSSQESLDSNTLEIGLGTPAAVGVPTVSLAGSSATNASMTVRWSAPDDGGSPITGYDLQVIENGNLVQTVPVSGRTTAFVLRKLTPGARYEFAVSARNARGAGDPSGLSTPAYLAFPASAPSRVRAEYFGPGTATLVTWLPPASDGGTPVTGYRITPYLAGKALTALTQTVDASQLECDFADLAAGQAYTFGVQALNSAGAGAIAFSPAVRIVDVPAQVALPKVRIDGSAATGASVAVSWPAPTTGGSPITGYRVTPTVDGVQGAPVFVRLTSWVARNVPVGAQFSVDVAAVNAIGTGPASDATADALVAYRPGAPKPAVTAYAGSGTTVDVNWVLGDDGGSPLTGHLVTAYLAGRAVATQTASDTDETVSFSGLTAGKTYTFGVRAQNALGDGAEALTRPLAVVDVPQTVTTLSAVVGGTAARPVVTLTWKAPGTGAAPITGYDVTTYVNGVQDRTDSVRSTSLVVRAPQLGDSYEFEVTANNSAGAGFSSPLSTPVTVAFAAAPVTNASAVSVAGVATVSWRDSTLFTGVPDTAVIVTPYLEGRAQPALVQQIAPGVETVDFSTLVRGKSYTFGVRAVNTVGQAPEVRTAAVVVR